MGWIEGGGKGLPKHDPVGMKTWFPTGTGRKKGFFYKAPGVSTDYLFTCLLTLDSDYFIVHYNFFITWKIVFGTGM